ncbi:MAG: hypothetical protein RL266_2467 [Bacteroidota bacterium]|jgi:protein TonB
MKTLKTPLERKRPLLFAAGLLFALSLTLVSFEWRTPYRAPLISKPEPVLTEEVFWMLPIKLEEPEELKEKPELPKDKNLSTQIQVVEKLDETKQNQDPVLTLDELPKFEGTFALAPDPEVKDDIKKVLDRAPVMPEYCGGESAMFKFLSEELEYPEIPRMNGVTGKVYVRFVVGADGKARDAKIIRSVDPWLDAEALRVTKLLSCFTPGMQGGDAVDVYFILPIKFTLER